MATALRDTGSWAGILDDRWRYVYVTDDLRLSYGGLLELAPVRIGEHYSDPRLSPLACDGGQARTRSSHSERHSSERADRWSATLPAGAMRYAD